MKVLSDFWSDPPSLHQESRAGPGARRVVGDGGVCVWVSPLIFGEKKLRTPDSNGRWKEVAVFSRVQRR